MGSREVAHDCEIAQTGWAVNQGWDGEAEGREAALSSSRLHQVVLDRIVPRLAFLHQRTAAELAEPLPTSQDIEEFGQAILVGEPTAADQFFLRMRERGFSADQLFETLLAPTARWLGDLWSEDVVDFVEVTLGVNRLRMILEAYARAPGACGEPFRRALLVSTPEESHQFGLEVVASFLRASGWDTVVSWDRHIEGVAQLVAESHFAVVGVTISNEAQLAPAARMVAAIRRASFNPAIGVMVGGWALRERPDLAVRVGGDAVAENGPSAALLAQRLYVTQLASRARAQHR